LAGIEPFVLRPFSERCKSVCDRREHVVLGVSPGNSYFSVANLTRLLGWLFREFRRVDVVIPDSALQHNYIACGYPPGRAAQKARGEIGALRNRVLRAWGAADGAREGDSVHMMSDVTPRPGYQRLLVQVEQALAEDVRLRETGLHMTRAVLAPPDCGPTPTARQLEQGLRYLVAELPFFVDSAAIFDVPSSVCFYHQPIPMADLIFADQSMLRPSPRQGYALITPAQSPAQSPTENRVRT
jgi:cyclo(L-tyrosyl-L-tyrosyl) synthase